MRYPSILNELVPDFSFRATTSPLSKSFHNFLPKQDSFTISQKSSFDESHATLDIMLDKTHHLWNKLFGQTDFFLQVGSYVCVEDSMNTKTENDNECSAQPQMILNSWAGFVES